MLPGRTPTKSEQQHMDRVAALGCIVCRLHHYQFTPAEIHHTQGKTIPGCHKKVIPLCWRHHREGVNDDRYVSRHPHKAEFEHRYGTEAELLEKTRDLLGREYGEVA